MKFFYKEEIIKEAVSLSHDALFSRDSSKYEKVLFEILKILAPEIFFQESKFIENDNKEK